jgi:hypothetical protein
MRHGLVVLLATGALAAALEGLASELSTSQNAVPLFGRDAKNGHTNSREQSTMGGSGSSFLGKDVPFFDASSNGVRGPERTLPRYQIPRVLFTRGSTNIREAIRE